MTEFLVRQFIHDGERVQDPAVREKYGLLSGAVGIVLNLLLTAAKLLAGILSGSIAMTADAFNNLSDAGSSVVTLVGFRLAGQKADDDHPFGHGRMEYLAGLLVALIILLVGVELGKTSVERILDPVEVGFSPAALVILGISILVKLWLFRFNRTLSRRIGSAAMAATAADSLSDAAATGAVLISALLAPLAALPIDGWAGLLVAVFILRAGWGAVKDTINPLLGQSPDPALVQEIQAAVLAHPLIVGMHDLVIHDYGPGRRIMSFHAEVPMDADLMEVHDIIDGIERALEADFHIETSIHMDPIATNDARINGIRAETAALVQEIHPDLTIHDFRMTDGPKHTNLIFDVAAPHSLPLTDEALCQTIAQALRRRDPRWYAVIRVDRTY